LQSLLQQFIIVEHAVDPAVDTATSDAAVTEQQAMDKQGQAEAELGEQGDSVTGEVKTGLDTEAGEPMDVDPHATASSSSAEMVFDEQSFASEANTDPASSDIA